MPDGYQQAPVVQPKFHAPILGLEVPSPTAEQRASAHDDWVNAINQQLGRKTGNIWHEPSADPHKLGPAWTEYNQGTDQNPIIQYAKPSPNKNKVFIRGQNEALPGTEYYLGGPLGEQKEAIQKQINTTNGGQNPQTGKPWAHNITGTNLADLQNIQQTMERSQYQQAPPTTVEALRVAQNSRDLLKDIEDQYKVAGGSENLNKVQQALRQLGRETDADGLDTVLTNWKKNATNDPVQNAYMQIVADRAHLYQNGLDVGNLSGKGNNETANVLNGILGGASVMHPLVSAAVGAVINPLKEIAQGQWNNPDLRYDVPYQRAQLNNFIYNTGKTLSGPLGKTLFQPEQLQWIRNAAIDNEEKYGLKEGDPLKVPPIEEPEHIGNQQQAPIADGDVPNKENQQKGPDTSKDQSETSNEPMGIPGGPGEIGAVQKGMRIAGDWWNKNVLGARPQTITNLQPAPIGPQTIDSQQILPGQSSSQLESNRLNLELPAANAIDPNNPRAVPPATIPNQHLFQNPPHPSSSTGEASNLPHLTEQEHVDDPNFPPGTPFMWRDHPDPYVKV